MTCGVHITHDRISGSYKSIMAGFNRKRFVCIPTRLLKIVLGSALLVSILAVNIPAGLVANLPMCELACCAGRAPHADGSCMNGSCHAFLTGHTNKSQGQRVTGIDSEEQLCGLAPLKLQRSRLLETVTADFSDAAAAHSQGTAKAVSRIALTKPCQPDCGACPSGFMNSSRRNTAVLRYADCLRPHIEIGPANDSYRLAQTLNALCRRGTTRGPPLHSSWS
jgi:hypothetical protein